jgi:hypothetical protein
MEEQYFLTAEDISANNKLLLLETDVLSYYEL